MQLKKGFTLVEVLIALAILGIVAAATIYVLINAIPKEHEYLAKKPAVTLSYGVKTLLENDKIYPNKAFEGGEKFCDNYVKIFSDIGSTNCEQPSNISDNKFFSGDKLPDNIYALTNLTTSTGETWIGLNQKFKDEKTPIKIIVDVNGPNKGNNILGEDVVLLSLYQNGKIGEYEASDSTTDQKTHKYVDCSKCKLVKTPVENSCSAAYKGKIKLVCEPYPQCSRDGGPYACCAYIFNHYREFPWGAWTAQGRATTDDVGNVCFQPCESLVKKPNTVTSYCSDGSWKTKHDTYWLDGNEIVPCRKNPQVQKCVCKGTKSLDYTIVIGDMSKAESADRDWIMGQANYAAVCTRGSGLRDCSGSQTIPKSDLGLPADGKVTKCECENIRSLDWANSQTHNSAGSIGGTFSCSCSPTDNGIKATLSTRYQYNNNYVEDYDDWGVSEFYLEYESDNCN